MASLRPLLRRNSRSGFSLLEALVALGLTGMLFAVGLPLFVQFVGSWTAGNARSMAADEWMSASSRIRDDLAQAMPLKMQQSSDKAMAFRGSRSEVDFVRTSLGGKGNFRLESVSLLLKPRGSAAIDIIRVARPFLDVNFESSPAISAGVSLLQLRKPAYFDYVDIHGKIHGSWDPDAGLPSGVELKLNSDDAKMMGLSYFVFPIVGGA